MSEIIVSREQLEANNLIIPKNISDIVFNTVQEYQNKGIMTLPKNYDVGTALKSAWLTIQGDSKLMNCNRDSLLNSMLDMVVLGLNPAKKQCYFVSMGTSCALIPSYFGKQAAVKRLSGVIDIRSDVIYKGTKYELVCDEYGNDNIKILNPCPLEERKKENMIGAWCKIIMNKDICGSDSYCTIMTNQEIESAWKMNRGGINKTHEIFFVEMAKKSVISRCTKNYINTLDDSDNIFVETLNKVNENDFIYDEQKEKQNEEVFKEKNIDASNIFEAEFEEGEIL